MTRVPPEQTSLNVSRQTPERPSQDDPGDEADALDVASDAPNIVDREDVPVADLAQDEPALWDSETGEALDESDEADESEPSDEGREP
jgi:hypothetical protein